MKTRHEYGNKPEASENEEEISEEVKFKEDSENAKTAFLTDQRHQVVNPNAKSDDVQTEPAVEAELHTDVIHRCNRDLDNRRNSLNDRRKKDRRIGAN